ncbi:MAG: ATPase, T2SS/T4P/T4SS family [Pseudomonadota bacterium]
MTKSLTDMLNRTRTGKPSDRTQAVRSRQTLGARLKVAGLINDAQLDLALREQKRSGKLLGEVLVELGFVSAEIITQTMARQAQAQMVDVRLSEPDEHTLSKISFETAKRFKAFPLSINQDTLTVAFADAFNVVAIDYVERESEMTINVVTAPEGHILEAIARHYARGRSIEDTIDEIMSDGSLPSEDEAASGSPLVRLVDQIVSLGIKRGATDIHIEPDEKIVRVRMRIDGVLRQEILIPKPIQPALTARIKLIANLNITEKRIPQDGRIRFEFGQNHVDLRVSTLPINFGESIVLRILDGASSALELTDLGFSAPDTRNVEKLVELPYGMVLVTGPTGSGKTTTLYTALKLVNAEARSVFTLEDPIEYSLGKIRQTQVKPEVGLDFASGLRALLRQDPDVILIGEIRDIETAQLAARAALTGHLVLSTLHTNNAVGVIPRLVDMGVDRYMLPPALSAIVAQRLVRRLCKHCTEERTDSAALIERLGLSEHFEQEPTLYFGQGCEECNFTGFSGRQVIYEILNIDERFHAPIVNGTSAGEIRELAAEAGMVPMFEDGLKKALAGTTTIEEVLRVVR